MSVTQDTKKKVQEMLKPFFSENYDDQVRHPIVLLNYLHQHSIIVKPHFEVMDNSDEYQFFVSCKIGDIERFGYGNSKKIANKDAAQKVIDFLLDKINEVSADSGIDSQTSMASSDKIELQDFFVPDEVNFQESNCSMESIIPHAVDEYSSNLVNSQSMKSETFFEDSFPDMYLFDDTSKTTRYIQNVNEYFNPFAQFDVQKIPTRNTVVPHSQTTPCLTKTKTPFQILHENSIKKYKLIPRTSIEQINSNFICKVLLDTKVGIGEGPSKKKAKMVAASKLLNQLNFAD